MNAGRETGLADAREGRLRERPDDSPSSFSFLRSTLTRSCLTCALLQVSLHHIRGGVPLPARRAEAVWSQVCHGHHNSWILRFALSQTVLVRRPVVIELGSSLEAFSAEVALVLGQQKRCLRFLSLFLGGIRWPGS